MILTLGKARLGVGVWDTRFEGVRRGEQGSGRFATPPYVWTFSNSQGVLEIISSATPAVGNVCGDLLAITTGAIVGEEANTDVAVGKSFSIKVEMVGDKRQITITASDGRVAVVANGGGGE